MGAQHKGTDTVRTLFIQNASKLWQQQQHASEVAGTFCALYKARLSINLLCSLFPRETPFSKP